MWVKVEVRLIRIGQGDMQLACLAKRLSGLELNCWVAKLAFFPVWPNGWVFVYELSGSGFQSSCSHLNFRFHTCFKQGVPWHSGNYSVDSLWYKYMTWQEHTAKETCLTSIKKLNQGGFCTARSKQGELSYVNTTSNSINSQH